MKIRTITVGFNLELPLKKEQIEEMAAFAWKAREALEKEGYTVQTLRLATQPWEQYCPDERVVQLAKDLETTAKRQGMDYVSLGTAKAASSIRRIYDIIKDTTVCFCTASISDGKAINYDSARAAASLVKRLSGLDGCGFVNRKFSALFNVGPCSPFFPAAYHEGPASFAIGTENSDLVFKAFTDAGDISSASERLTQSLTSEYAKLERIAESLKSGSQGIAYGGIDASVATSIEPGESIAFAFEKLGLGEFGGPGTLAAAKAVTDALRRLNVRKCGYSGLMLPLLEDYGLAERNNEGRFGINDLILYSAVCGTGLDTVPIPGDTPEQRIYALFLDIASLSLKLNKPLSARLMPVGGKKAGEMTDYEFKYFVNTNIMPL